MSREEDKVYMLNVLWFKPDGGAATYGHYAKAVQPLLAAAGARVLDGYQPVHALIGDWDPDLLFIVEWPSWQVFQETVQGEAYAKIRHLREDALDRSLLIRCQKMALRESS